MVECCSRWKDQVDAIVRLEKLRDEAARDVTRDGVKFKFPEVRHEGSAKDVGLFPDQSELVPSWCHVDSHEYSSQVHQAKSQVSPVW